MAVTWVMRRATINDAPLLANLAAETFPLACPPGFDDAAIRLHIRRWLSADAFRINLADVGLEFSVALGAPDYAVGYVLLAGLDGAGDQEAPLLELKQIYVRQPYHGSGVSDALMGTAVARAEQLGFEGLWLGTSKQNARALAFYRRHGFHISGERVFFVNDLPNQDWVMVRSTRPAQ